MGISAKQAAEINEQRDIVLTNLAKKRVECNLSQRNLAVSSGVSVSVIRRLEQRVISIEDLSLKTLIALCMALNCDVVSVLEDDKVISEFNSVNNLKVASENEPRSDRQEIASDLFNSLGNSDTSLEELNIDLKTEYYKLFLEYLKSNYQLNLSVRQNRRLEVILGELPMKCVQALKLKYVDNLSNENISCEVRLSIQELEDMLMRSTRIIKSCLGDEAVARDLPIYNKNPIKNEPQISILDQPIKVLKLKIKPYDLLHKAGIKTVADAMIPKEELIKQFKMTEHMANEVTTRINDYINDHINDELGKDNNGRIIDV